MRLGPAQLNSWVRGLGRGSANFLGGHKMHILVHPQVLLCAKLLLRCNDGKCSVH